MELVEFLFEDDEHTTLPKKLKTKTVVKRDDAGRHVHDLRSLIFSQKICNEQKFKQTTES